MKNLEKYNVISKKSLNIIKSNSPEKSISKISNIKLSDNSKIGADKALKIYKFYSDKSVEYKSSLYRNDITSYKNKIDSNIKKASKFAKSN